MTFSGNPAPQNLQNLTLRMGAGYDNVLLGGSTVTLSERLTITGEDVDLTVQGGTLNVPRLVLPVSGEIRGFGQLRSRLSGAAAIAADGGTLTVGDGSFGAVTYDGLLHVGGDHVTLDSAARAILRGPVELGGGTLDSTGGIGLVGAQLHGYGTVGGPISLTAGSSITAGGGDLALGDAAAFDGFFSDGDLHVADRTVTLHDLNEAVLGSLTSLGNGAQPGTLSAPHGLLLAAGRTVQGEGTIDTTSGKFTNQGFVQ